MLEVVIEAFYSGVGQSLRTRNSVFSALSIVELGNQYEMGSVIAGAARLCVTHSSYLLGGML